MSCEPRPCEECGEPTTNWAGYCSECCDHEETDHGICSDCGEDCTDSLVMAAEAAFEGDR